LLATAIPLNPEWHAGEIMAVEDHINLLGDTPLIGRAASSATPFLDMGNAYDRTLLDEAISAAEKERFSLKRGVFVASPLAQSYDPSALESLRQAGGDACGTGVVPHVLTARDASIAVLALGTIRGMDTSDAALNLALTSTRASEETATRLTAILRRLIRGHVEDKSGGNAPESRQLSESACGGGTH
jgi:purine-nucleoside phosphorylase